jgi:protein-S-isoprenylcysteine O-methyltransferase Ste14
MTPTPRSALITIGVTIACLGLAVLGRICRLLLPPAPDCPCDRTLCPVWRSALQWRQSQPRRREDRANRWVIIAFAVIGLLSAYLPAYTDRKEFWTIDGESIRWLGVVLFAAGGALRIWPVFVLAVGSGLVAIQPGHTLVTTGIYRIIRHPSYVRLLGVRAFRSWRSK